MARDREARCNEGGHPQKQQTDKLTNRRADNRQADSFRFRRICRFRPFATTATKNKGPSQRTDPASF